MSHDSSVFANLCVRVPLDPVTKMPRTGYERKPKSPVEQASIESSSTTGSVLAPSIEAERLKEFYQSIPDYKDVHHLSPDEFYSTLKILREQKSKMIHRSLHDINDVNIIKKYNYDSTCYPKTKAASAIKLGKQAKSEFTRKVESNDEPKNIDRSFELVNKVDSVKEEQKKSLDLTCEFGSKDEIFNESVKGNKIGERIVEKENIKPKRNHSACSISWNDTCKVDGQEVDKKFSRYFYDKSYGAFDDLGHKCRSMPSSPIRVKRVLSPGLRRRSATVSKPFKMTERDEDARIVSELRGLQKSLSSDMLPRAHRQFRARPVPVESRIPLYDKILEDQAMRRAITKMNSEAELRASMKPFTFSRREESRPPCDRGLHLLPKKKKKRFRARPVPKNLFSNYVYDKMREDEFFRNINRRIRAEELLRQSALPGDMAARDSRLSTPAAHSDLPVDPSGPSSERHTAPSPTKDRRRNISREEFITTSPQPFRFTTADRAAKKLREATKNLYERKSASSFVGSSVFVPESSLGEPRDRSNLAALLREGAARRRLQGEAARQGEERGRRAELRSRGRLLRARPGWQLVRNNHEEEIAMRLQTRRDEERMRREEFLHEMELMQSRVRSQPLLFERHYAPRSLSADRSSRKVSYRW